MEKNNKKINICVADDDYIAQHVPIAEHAKNHYLRIILIVCVVLVAFIKPEVLNHLHAFILAIIDRFIGMPLFIFIFAIIYFFLFIVPAFKSKKRCFEIFDNKLIITDRDAQLTVNISDIKSIHVKLNSATEVLKLIVLNTAEEEYQLMKESNIAEFAKLRAFLCTNFPEQTDKNMLDKNVEKILNNENIFFLEKLSFNYRILIFSIGGILAIIFLIGVVLGILFLTHEFF